MIRRSQSMLDEFEGVPSRVVSLVPSISDSLFAFGLSSKVVGVTDYCPSTESAGSEPLKIGGTKNQDPRLIIDLSPDLVIANQEENDRALVEKLDESGLDIWLTFPKTVSVAMADLRIMARIFNLKHEALSILETLERTFEWMRLANLSKPAPKFFCPIWEDKNHSWWMTFNEGTFAHDILSLCGGANTFALRERLYPLAADLGEPKIEEGRDTRYPRVTVEEVIQTNPDVIILPSEPYSFQEQDRERFKDLLAGTPAVENGKIVSIDGRLVTWHGIKMARAFAELPSIFDSI